jgi:hypothetical protein
MSTPLNRLASSKTSARSSSHRSSYGCGVIGIHAAWTMSDLRPAEGSRAGSEPPDVATAGGSREPLTRHLDLRKPRKEFFGATATVEPFSKRDEIESAANHFQTVSELAYFYAGLAFGVTFADCGMRH